MTPGERRRRDRKWAREEWCLPCRAEYKHITDEQLKALPHPKMSSPYTAYNYVDWLIQNGHHSPLRKYLESL
jgi:hypothetical protein